MIETHAVNALLKTSLREGAMFSVLNFINGLVAPSFLFCAGLAFAITLNKRWQEYIELKQSFWRYVMRLLFIIVVGYSLHLPLFSLTRMMNETSQDGWSSFFQADILQVISITILFMLCLVLLIQNRSIFLQIAAILTIVIVFVSPPVRDRKSTRLNSSHIQKSRMPSSA